MIYSRFLYTEHEDPPGENGEGAFTIFSTQQINDRHLNLMDEICIQRFAVLWDKVKDTRIIDLIERSIVQGVLSPVKLLHASKGTLMVVYDHRIVQSVKEDLEEAWQDLAGEVMYYEWTAELIPDSKAGSLACGGRILRQNGPTILLNDLGITEFTRDMFLFAEEWKAEAVFGPDAKPSNLNDPTLRDPDFLDDDIGF
ncbi:hypothetical protein [Pseudomonas putida]|uniref:hypothetical protein n=1 Tax=Pseudomonas putida TaxID=303 RepID=UPI0018D90679|nr:hypothetical protein [Pseudomonas putida]MBH3469942.1 hypothetical protein [Pseudomonas putida]